MQHETGPERRQLQIPDRRLDTQATGDSSDSIANLRELAIGAYLSPRQWQDIGRLAEMRSLERVRGRKELREFLDRVPASASAAISRQDDEEVQKNPFHIRLRGTKD